MRTSLLLLLMALPFAVNAQSEFNSTARSAASAAGGSVSGLNAQESLGVTASGSMNSGSRDVNVNYAQVLEGDFRCPADGSAGRRSGIGQFVVQCEPQTGNSRKVWVCVPNDPNDTMGRECENGQWFNSSLAVGNASWTGITSGVKVRVPSCDEDDCEVQLRRSGEFDGGQGAAEAQGESTIANSNGAHQTINNQGAYLPDGTALRPGSNPNSGQLAGEMVAANSTASCADDIKTSLNEGTPVFTCDGQKEVGVLTENQGECEDVETCLETETETLTSTQRCTVSVLYEGAECNVQTPTKDCTVTNIYKSYTCNKSVSSDVRVRLRYDKKKSCSVYPATNIKMPAFNGICDHRIVYNIGADAIRSKVISYPVEYRSNGQWSGRVSSGTWTSSSQVTAKGMSLYGPLPPNMCNLGIDRIELCSSSGSGCASGYTESGDYCVESVDVGGYSYIGQQATQISGYDNPVYQYFESSSVNNGCSVYENSP